MEILAIKIHNIHLDLSPCYIHSLFSVFARNPSARGLRRPYKRRGIYSYNRNRKRVSRQASIADQNNFFIYWCFYIKLQNVMIHANGIHFNTFETDATGGLRGDLNTWKYYFVVYRYSGTRL